MATACLAMIGGSLWATTTLNLAPAPWAAPAPAPAPPNLTVTPNSTDSIADTGGAVILTITTDTTWTATSSEGWAKLSASSGVHDGSVNVTIDPNTGGSKRTATITVYATDIPTLKQVITIAQKAQAPAVKPVIGISIKDKDTIVVGGTLSLTATLNPSDATTQTVTWTSSSPAVTVPAGSTGLSVTVKGEAPGDANVTVKTDDGGHTATCQVHVKAAPAAPTLTATPASIDVDEKAHTASVTIQSNKAWKVEIEAGKSWLTTSDATGTGEKTITLNIEANTSAARTAKLTIKTTTGTGDQTVDITISQSGTGPTLVLDTAALMGTQPFTGANRVVKVKSNSLWVATSGAEWIRILDGQGNEQSTRPGGNDQDITIRIKPNTTNAPRTATITFKTNREGVTNITKTVTVTQAASSFSYSITGLADPVDAAGAQATVTLNSTTGYAISTRGTDWLKIQDGTQPEKDSIGFSGSQHSLYLLVKGNDGGIRTGYLRIYSNGVLVETRKVTQAGNNITAQLVTPGNIPVGGGTKDVKVSSPTSWEILITGDWLVVDKKKKVESSVNDTLITFRAKDKNPGLTARTATVTFQTKRGQGKTSITLTQDGSFSMIYDKSQFEKVSQKGAQRLTVVVKSEKPWKPSVVEIPATKSGPQLRAKVVEKDTTLSWLSISYERENATRNDGEMKIDVKPNTGTTSREAKILLTLTDGTPLDTIVLRQFNAEGKLTPHGTTTPVTALKFSKTSVSININKAKTLQLSVTVVPDNASNKTVLWSSSDTSIAKVDTKGLVTVQKEGKAIITATAADGSGVKATCEVNVLTTDANAALEGLKIYATAGQLHLSLPAAHDVRIYTLTGALVRTLTAPAGDTTLALPAGLYIVRAGNAVQKVIVE